MIIYKHTSKTSGKSYIGLTQKTLEERLNGHINNSRKGSETNFHSAIRKYGIEDFISEVLESGIKDIDELKLREQYWIEYYDTYKNGYNMTLGGDFLPYELQLKGAEKRSQKNENGVSSYEKANRKLAKYRKETIVENGKTLQQDIVDRVAKLRKERGDFEDLNPNGFALNKATCEFCNKETTIGNHKRWHGINCKKNPNITEKQLKKREPWNKRKEKNEK